MVVGVRVYMATKWQVQDLEVAICCAADTVVHPDHRRKGLALQTARACISYGVEHGYTQVGWHCWVKNEPSNKLAKSLGYKHVLNYPVEYLEVIK